MTTLPTKPIHLSPPDVIVEGDGRWRVDADPDYVQEIGRVVVHTTDLDTGAEQVFRLHMDAKVLIEGPSLDGPRRVSVASRVSEISGEES